MKNVILNTGVEMPVLGYGVYQISDLKECEKCVLDALEIGYRSIDTAAAYQNEEAVGKAIKESGIKREEIFLTTKLWISDTGYERTKRAFDRSVRKLRTDYLDLFLIHQPFGDIYGSWRAMEELVETGKVKAIGISNFHPDRVMDLIIHNRLIPAVNQIETHPFCQQKATHSFLKENSIQIESWGPFAEGRNNLFSNELLSGIAKNQNKSIAQVTLRWLLQRDVVIIPKTVSKARMKENFNIFDFELTNVEMNAIASLDKKTSLFFDHRNPAMVKQLSSYKLPD
jgi:diketogulonate reductase-like aldo/keto reductase